MTTPLPASLDHEDLAAQFAYDRAAPLDPQIDGHRSEGRVRVEDMSYASPRGERVPAWLALPDHDGPYPAILFLHSSSGSRDDFLTEAERYARRGAACLTITAAHSRPGHARFPSWSGDDREGVIQDVVDLRRGRDLLLERGDVDAARLAFVGLSYGADYGAVFCAVDGRLKACAFVSGGTLRDYYGRWSPDGVRDEYLELMESVAPDRYLPHVRGTRLLFQSGTQDRTYTRREIDDFQASATASKETIWYDAGHWLNDAAVTDRAAWLQRELGLAAG